jgi:hypothetical protein
MQRNVTSAVFETRMKAEAAIAALRKNGISDEAISVISKSDHDFEREHGHHTDHDHHDHTDTKASGAAKGLAIGAGGGAIAGLAALAIPGVAPFFAAGAVAEALGIVGSTAATSAVVGGAIGGITGALMKYGVDEEDARYFDEHLQRGGYWVGVDLDHSRTSRSEVDAILHHHDGTTSRRTHGDGTRSVDGVPDAIVGDTGRRQDAGTEPAGRTASPSGSATHTHTGGPATPTDPTRR